MSLVAEHVGAPGRLCLGGDTLPLHARPNSLQQPVYMCRRAVLSKSDSSGAAGHNHCDRMVNMLMVLYKACSSSMVVVA